MSKAIKLLMNLCVLAFLTACATTMPQGELSDPERDPHEARNRAVFEFNTKFDKAVLRPISSGYRAVVPKPARQGVSNFFRNLREPWVFVNDLLQGKFGRAGTTLSRFVINTTVGVGGLLKASDDMGIEYHQEDFGQTLAVWGVSQGKYTVVPFIGPSSPRDFTGFVAGVFGDPTTYTLDELEGQDLVLTYLGASILDTRARLHPTIEELYKEKDPYIVARAAYFQNRDFQLRDGKIEQTDEDDLFDELDEEDEDLDTEEADK